MDLVKVGKNAGGGYGSLSPPSTSLVDKNISSFSFTSASLSYLVFEMITHPWDHQMWRREWQNLRPLSYQANLHSHFQGHGSW